VGALEGSSEAKPFAPSYDKQILFLESGLSQEMRQTLTKMWQHASEFAEKSILDEQKRERDLREAERQEKLRELNKKEEEAGKKSGSEESVEKDGAKASLSRSSSRRFSSVTEDMSAFLANSSFEEEIEDILEATLTPEDRAFLWGVWIRRGKHFNRLSKLEEKFTKKKLNSVPTPVATEVASESLGEDEGTTPPTILPTWEIRNLENRSQIGIFNCDVRLIPPIAFA
jgi:hypothetical protein